MRATAPPGLHVTPSTTSAERSTAPARGASFGARYDASGKNIGFNLFSKNATRIQLELFSSAMGEDAKLVVPLKRGADGRWSVNVSVEDLKKHGITEPVLYGY